MQTLKQFSIRLLLLVAASFLLNSCGLYRQNIMFETDGKVYQELAKVSEKNYIIEPGDIIDIEVFSNKGELIIDPNLQLRKEIGLQNNVQIVQNPEYLVKPDSLVKLPMIGNINLVGLSLAQSDQLLSEVYSEYYVDAFVITTLKNRRVVVLGATGGQVIPLTNENMTVLEIIALAGGISNDAKAHNIRLIRGDKKNPQVQVINLSTIEGMKDANLGVQPNDIIYIEPIRKVVSETVRDLSPILTLLTSILTLSIILSRN